MRVPCVYNSPPWGIRQFTINELATLWDVPLFLKEKLEELDKSPCWFNFLSSVPGKTLLLARDYLISLRIREGWCSITCIDLKVKVQDTVIQQVLSTSVPLPLPMMEDEVVGEILKVDVQKEDDAAPPFVLWYSWFYRSWKVDKDMIHPLA